MIIRNDQAQMLLPVLIPEAPPEYALNEALPEIKNSVQQPSSVCEPTPTSPPPYSLEPLSRNGWITATTEDIYMPSITEIVNIIDCPANSYSPQGNSSLMRYDSFLEDLDQVISKISKEEGENLFSN